MGAELAIFVGFAAVLGLIVAVLGRADARRRTEQDQRLAREAQERGWRFETAVEGRFRVRRWHGRTDNLDWTAESLRAVSGKRQHRRQERLRWSAASARGPAGPVLFMGVPPGAETPAFAVATGDGTLAALARKVAGMALDHAIDAYFGVEMGREVDAGALRQVGGETPSGYLVMAADPSEGARVLFAGMRAVIDGVRDDLRHAEPGETLPWILLLPRRVALARTDAIQTTAEVERLARAGTTIVRRS